MFHIVRGYELKQIRELGTELHGTMSSKSPENTSTAVRNTAQDEPPQRQTRE